MLPSLHCLSLTSTPVGVVLGKANLPDDPVDLILEKLVDSIENDYGSKKSVCRQIANLLRAEGFGAPGRIEDFAESTYK